MQNINPDNSQSNRARPELNIEKQIKSARIAFWFVAVLWLVSFAVVILDSTMLKTRIVLSVLFVVMGFNGFGFMWADYRSLIRRRAREMSQQGYVTEVVSKSKAKIKIAWVSWFFYMIVGFLPRAKPSDWLQLIFLCFICWFFLVFPFIWDLHSFRKRMKGIYRDTKSPGSI